jgi:hypothetical protein
LGGEGWVWSPFWRCCCRCDVYMKWNLYHELSEFEGFCAVVRTTDAMSMARLIVSPRESFRGERVDVI